MSPRARPHPLLLIALLIVSGCGPTAPSPSPTTPTTSTPSSIQPSATAPAESPAASQDIAAIYRDIEAQVVAIRGLQPTRPVEPKILDEDQLATYVKDQFAKDNPPATVAANERLLKSLGLLPESASLADLEISMLTGQVAGLYSPTDRALYVVSKTGSLGPTERVTFAHEFTHALQDQHYDLTKFGVDTVGQGDRSLARLALVEGDATTVMSFWAQAHLTTAELLQLTQEAADPAQLALLGQLPAILRETLLFPYQSGLQFVLGLQASGGWPAVDRAFASPPDSTEQILHPEKYAAHEKPIAVALPSNLAAQMGTGWKVALEDTLGEFDLRIWLREVGGLPEATAEADAGGWGGDRVELLTGPSGKWAVVLETRWDTADDASQFVSGARAAIATGRLQGVTALVLRCGLVSSCQQPLAIASDSQDLLRLESTMGIGLD